MAADRDRSDDGGGENGVDGGDGSDGGPAADGAETPSSRSGGGPTCPHCDGRLYKRHCKYVCQQHGVVFDCADTFWL